MAIELIFLLAGLVVGSSAAWVLLRDRAKHAGLESSAGLQAQLAANAEKIAGRDAQILDLQGQFKESQAEKRVLLDQSSKLLADKSGLQAMLDNEKKSSEEKLKLLDEAKARLSDTFAALSSDALRKNNETFLQNAKREFENLKESTKGELASKQQAIDNLIKPIQQTLDKLNQNVGDIEKKRIDAYSELKKQVELMGLAQNDLKDQTGNLARALSAPGSSGRWGEFELRKVVELSGMTEHIDFDEQVHSAVGDDVFRPDMVINLPNEAVIFVDSKVSPDLYMQAVTETDSSRRAELVKKYAAQIKKRVEELSKREYWKIRKESVDFAILFLAGEPLFSLAAQGDPDLIEYALQNRVLIATPVNLLAMLRSVAYVWSQSEAYKNTTEIKLEVQKFYDSLTTVLDHMAGIGSGLEDAIKAYNASMNSINARLVPPARKILASGLAQDKIGKGKAGKGRSKQIPKEITLSPLKLAGTAPEQVELMGMNEEEDAVEEAVSPEN